MESLNLSLENFNECFDSLVHSKNWKIRYYLACNKDCPEHIKDILANDSNYYVKKYALLNKCCA